MGTMNSKADRASQKLPSQISSPELSHPAAFHADSASDPWFFSHRIVDKSEPVFGANFGESPC